MTEKGKAREPTGAHQALPGWGGPSAPASTSSSSPSGGYSDTSPTIYDAAYDPASFHTPGQLVLAASHPQHAGYIGFPQQVEDFRQSAASLVPESEGADSSPPVYSKRVPSRSSGWSAGASGDLGRTPTLMSDSESPGYPNPSPLCRVHSGCIEPGADSSERLLHLKRQIRHQDR